MKFFPSRGDDRRASRRRRASAIGSLTLESLESRQLLAAGSLGINLAPTLGFVDLMKEAPDFVAINSSTPLTTNAQGWPTSDAAVLVLDERVNEAFDGPDPNAVQPDIGGTYHLSFQGQATVSPPGWLQIYTVQNQVYNAATNTTTADLVVQHNAYAFLEMVFTNTVNPASSTGAGVTNVRLIQPGYAANTTQLFTNNFLDDLAPFSTIRYVNPDSGSNYGVNLDSSGHLIQAQWAQRTLPDARSQDSPSNTAPGEAWEYMIALANATNTDMWINVPATASDDYVAQLASLIKNGDTVDGVYYAGLNPNLKVYVEYANEVWGGSYNSYAVNTEATKEEIAAGNSTLNDDGDTNQYDWAARRYLQRTMQIANIFRSVSGADPTDSRIRPVLATQENNWQYYAEVLPWFDATYGLPSNYFYGMGATAYMDVTDYSSEAAILAGLQAQEAQAMVAATDLTTLATYYGLKNVSYEGGPDIGGTGTAGQNALLATRDPAIEAIVEQHYLNFYAAGGTLAEFFDGPFGVISPQYEWSSADVYEAGDPTLSAKYRGLVDVTQAAPVTPTVGTVVSSTGLTSLTATADSLGETFQRPSTGQINTWLLNVATAGAYNVTLTTGANTFPTYPAPGYSPVQLQVSTADGTPLGTYTVTQNGTFNLGNIALHAGLNTLTIKTIVGAYNPGDVSAGQHEIEPTALSLTPLVSPMTIDAGDPWFSTVGSWLLWQGKGHAGNLDEEAYAGTGTIKADWNFSGIAPGRYNVQVTWPAYANRATNAPYTISDGSTVLATAAVNQQLNPVGTTDSSGTTYQTIATVVVGSDGQLKVELSNLANGNIEADGVKLVAAASVTAPPAPPQPLTISAGTSGFSTVGNWILWAGHGHAGNLDEEAYGGDGTTKADYTFTGLAATQYLVKITWPGYPNRATNVPYTISDGTTSLGTYLVNQQPNPVGTTDPSGTNWQQLAIVTATSGTLKVELSNLANGNIEADAVQIIADPGATTTSPPVVPPPLLINAGDPGFSTVGSWILWQGHGHAGKLDEEAYAGDGTTKADYSFTGLSNTQYLVLITWPGYPNRATNVPYTISDGTTSLGTYLVNQQPNPVGTTDSSGTTWQQLAIVTATSGTLKVELSNLANGNIEADAVQLVPDPGAATTTPPVVNNPLTISAGGSGFSTVGAWQNWAGQGHARGLDEEAQAGDGSSKADFTFTGLKTTQYIVRITWPAYMNRGTDVPYTIFDGTTSLGTFLVNQQLAPSGMTDSSGTVWQQLAIVNATSGTLTVEISNLSNGVVEADAVQILASPGATTSSPPPPVYYPVVLGAGMAGFTTTGSWIQWPGQGHARSLDEEAYAGDGSSKADWSFTGLAAGTYVVQITWPPYANRATNAPYSIYDGSKLLNTYAINQQASPTGTADSSGTVWQTLGNVSISSGTLEVELSNLANGNVEADAVKILRIN